MSLSVNNNNSLANNPDLQFNWRAVVAEFIGTTVFVFLGTMAAVFATQYEKEGASQTLHIGLGHVFALISMIHTFAPISGAHFNPAVTFATAITRHIGVLQAVLYVFAQFVGGIAGAALTLLIGGRTPANLGAFQLKGDDFMRGFALEIVLTFILVTAIFGTAVKSQHVDSETSLDVIVPLFVSIPIAMTVGACYCAGTLTGSAMNPARAFGPELLAWSWNRHSWIYYSAPWIGALAAGVVFEFVLTKPRRNYIRLK